MPKEIKKTELFDIFDLKKIETPRLIIRPVKLGDQFEISEAIWASLEDLQRWMPWAKDPSFETTEAFVKKSDMGWHNRRAEDFPMVVMHKEDQKIIGATGFNEQSDPQKGIYEIGYWMHKKYQGKGLMRECVNALTKFALVALQAKYVQICTQTDNNKSVLIAKSCGYQLEETLKTHRIDCLSGKSADSFLFVCDCAEKLPGLAVDWK